MVNQHQPDEEVVVDERDCEYYLYSLYLQIVKCGFGNGTAIKSA